jgi:hypothetical protein
LEFVRLIEWDVARFGAVEDQVNVIGHTLSEFAEVRRIGHQPAQIDVVAVWIDNGKTVLLGQFGYEGTLRQKTATLVNDYSVELLLRHLGEGEAQLGVVHLQKLGALNR